MNHNMKNGLIIDEYGNKYWYLNDQFHREDGPAVPIVDGHWDLVISTILWEEK